MNTEKQQSNFMEGVFNFIEYDSIQKTKFPIKINAYNLKKHSQQEINLTNLRKTITQSLKVILAEGQSILKVKFLNDNKGLFCSVARSHLMDQIIYILYNKVKNYLKTKDPISLLAVGGFGRGELAPFSDIDLLFLTRSGNKKISEKFVHFILYTLWDLGLSVGHSTRNIADVINDSKRDIILRTSVLENRYLAGDKKLFNELNRKFKLLQKRTVSEFINLKLKEQENRHHKMGDSRYMLEPNIKENKGCLRDLNTLFWISKYHYKFNKITEIKKYSLSWSNELKRFNQALDFLMTIRCHLHYISKKDDNILNFSAQEQIAKNLGFKNRGNTLSVERFMKRFYLIAKDVGSLTRLFCTELDNYNNSQPIYSSETSDRDWKNFELKNRQVFYYKNKTEGKKGKVSPIIILKIFKFAQNRNLDIHPSTIYSIINSIRTISEFKNKIELYNIFVRILLSSKNSEKYLRLMNECGVLGKLFPDFQKIVGLMQYNMYHHYTVDEHTLRSIGFLHKLEKGDLREVAPIASRLIRKIQSRKVLFISIFLHDIGKGRNEDHSKVGVEIAKNICLSLGLKDEEIENVLWLVKNHLLMSKIAFNYDVSDPKTIDDFTKIVQSPEKLKLLLILTVADILAVGPGIWNSWKAALMRDLFRLSEEVLYGANPYHLLELNPDNSMIKTREYLTNWENEEFSVYSSQYPRNFWSALDVETHVWLAKKHKTNRKKIKQIDIFFKKLKNTNSILIVVIALDNPGLFSDIAGAISIQGTDIQTAKIFTRKDGMATDFFWVKSNTSTVFDKEKLDKIKQSITKSIKTNFNPEKQIFKLWKSTPERIRSLKSLSRVIVDNNMSNSQTIIEVNCQNKPGLLYKLTKEIKDLNLQIQSASVSTYGNSAVDVFYVKDVFGMKIENEKRINLIKKNIQLALMDNFETEKIQ